ncbi:MAG: chemotaxis protein CheW [Hydrococcus sp. Prado102]|jgi:positive phototaxis protein PixI|nr:chemotaxis protein CheW [Hydrococcus sp. Prado102]
MDAITLNNLNQLTSLNDFSAPLSEEQFLRFYLEPDIAGMLSLSQLTEVLTIPVNQILPIPHMNPSMMGVYNWRGEILWMVDLGHLVGLTSLSKPNFKTSNYRAMVLQLAFDNSTQEIGLVVDRIDDIEWCHPHELESPSTTINPKLVPFLRGCWIKPEPESKSLVAFDGNAIFNQLSVISN